MTTLARAGFAEKRFDAGEVTLNYVEGPANGPPLVLLPGQTMPWQSYTKVLPLLARRFHVFALDVRGHGRSGWTTGRYRFGAMGRDVVAFLRGVVKRPAILSGNSSGGVIAVAAAAEAPELVLGLVPEDPPLFSCEYPRILQCYVAQVLESAMRHCGGPGPRDVPGFFSELSVPTQGSQAIMKFPKPAVQLVRFIVWCYRLARPDGPIDLPFLPLAIRLFVKGLSEYDPDFSRACLDGSIHADFSHEAALKQVRCPVLLLQADWFMHPTLGLVGAMNDDDVARVKACLPQVEVQRVHGAHQLHVDRPHVFVDALARFSARLPG